MAMDYLRYPDVHDDLLTFVAADDVWVSSFRGGKAWRLSADNVPVSNPVVSPDGQFIAWVSRRDGHPEVMVSSVTGRDQQRLTYFGCAVVVLLGWTGEGQVVVSTPSGQPNRRDWVARAVALDGTMNELPFGPVSGVAMHPDGRVAVTTPYSRPPAYWKRYRGGTAPRLWLHRDSHWERLLSADTAGIVSPGWVGDDLIFASDRSAHFPDRTQEQANLFALDPDADCPRQVTFHTEQLGYVRDPRTDGASVVYHAGGQLYRLRGLDARPQPIDVTLMGSAPSKASYHLAATPQDSRLRPDEHADASVCEWRGRVAWVPHQGGPARIVAGDSGVRCREAHVVPGHDAVVWVRTGPTGDDQLEWISVSDPCATVRVVAQGRMGRVLDVSVHPAGDRAALITHDGRVLVVSFHDGLLHEVGVSPHGAPSQLAWSVDGNAVVWSQPIGHEESNRQLMVWTGTQTQELTSGRFDDFCACFTRDGRYLAFLSSRTFDPVVDEHGFGLGFVGTVRPYLVALNPHDAVPLTPSVSGWSLHPPRETVSGSKDEASSSSAQLTVEGFEDRVVAIPVPSANYRRLQAVSGGLVWIRESSDRGELGANWAGAGAKPTDVVERFSFSRRRARVLVDRVDDCIVSADGARMVVRFGDAVTVVPTAGPVAGVDDPARVEVDVSRVRDVVDRPMEWAQMLTECHRLMAQYYWREDMNGVDWGAVLARYRPLADRVASHDDLVDVLWEMVGELNTSHAYVMPPGLGKSPLPVGHLGVDLSPQGDGWRIDRILPSDSSDPQARSAWLASGDTAQPGDVIVAINDRAVDRRGVGRQLVGAVDVPVSVTVNRDGSSRRLLAQPLESESALRYQDWVRARAEYVTRRSGGRLGYVHIPDMEASGWAQLHRRLAAALAAEGVIVDVRYNSGGHLSQMVVGRLMQQVIAWEVPRYRDPSPYPVLGRRGPVAFVTNEHAGSDGDIICAAAQELSLGPVIGMRSWGGVVGIDAGFDLVDGTKVTQPRYAFWFRSAQWSIENWGVDPDIVVEHTPGDYARNDPQLDRAIHELLQDVDNSAAASPPLLPGPRVQRARFDSDG